MQNNDGYMPISYATTGDEHRSFFSENTKSSAEEIERDKIWQDMLETAPLNGKKKVAFVDFLKAPVFAFKGSFLCAVVAHHKTAVLRPLLERLPGLATSQVSELFLMTTSNKSNILRTKKASNFFSFFSLFFFFSFLQIQTWRRVRSTRCKYSSKSCAVIQLMRPSAVNSYQVERNKDGLLFSQL